MNKRILTVAVAALALSACSKNETVEIAGNQAIKFGNAFVNNSTRAMNDVTSASLTFFVYGNYGDAENSGNNKVFINDEFVWSGSGTATGKEAYWQANKYYNFGAYSDGNNSLESVTFDNTGVMAITDYTVGDNDLVMATPIVNYATGDANTDETVQQLTFRHLLSKVKFTFTTDYSAAHTVTVSDLKFTAANQGAHDGTEWIPGTADDEYAFTIPEFTSADGSSADECYVLPQSNAINATFTVTVSDGADYEITKEFTGSLAYDGNEWKEGFAYNYTVLINGDTMEETDPIIKFSASVDEWEDYTDKPIVE